MVVVIECEERRKTASGWCCVPRCQNILLDGFAICTKKLRTPFSHAAGTVNKNNNYCRLRFFFAVSRTSTGTSPLLYSKREYCSETVALLSMY